MVRKSALALCGMALWAAALALPASAQDVQIIKTLTAHGTFSHVTPAIPDPAPPFVIFSNFGTGTTVWSSDGWLILGATNAIDQTSEAIATPFTATTNSHVTKVEVPVQFFNIGDGATDGFEVSIYNDDGTGLPGTILVGPKAENANTTFPACCASGDAKTVTFPSTALAMNGHYWVIVDANGPGDGNTEDIWAYAGKNQVNYGINVGGQGWGAKFAVQSPAVKVTGTNP